MGTLKYDYNKWLITLTIVTLINFHYIMKLSMSYI